MINTIYVRLKSDTHCGITWLGLKYNSSINNYSWIDGSDMKFSMIKDWKEPEQNTAFMQYISGSTWLYAHEDEQSRFAVCQLRLSENKQGQLYRSFAHNLNIFLTPVGGK